MDKPLSTVAHTWQIKLLFDGDCPLCLREVNFLRQRDRGRGVVAFVDIAAADYNSEENAGIDYATAMGRIHAITADGQILQNVEVFRHVYALLGLGWLYAPTGWPLLRALVDWLYGLWAARRLALTGRPSLETLLALRQVKDGACAPGQCQRN